MSAMTLSSECTCISTISQIRLIAARTSWIGREGKREGEREREGGGGRERERERGRERGREKKDGEKMKREREIVCA